MTHHLHLDALGGVSGDMFVGALLDCRQDLAGALPELLSQAGFGGLVELSCERHHDGVLEGTAFRVAQAPKKGRRGHSHDHRAWADIRRRLEKAELPGAVRQHALGIFQHLAEAEARVHGTSVEAVSFHEVGAWDSIADVLCAALLIDALGIRSCSVSSLPLGSGQVDSAHGRLPVPAPAVSLLLENYRFHDDGREGERVTPTGAAILRHLDARQDGTGAGLALRQSGFGFGAKRFAGMSNVLRALLFDTQEEAAHWRDERIMELAFEIDDQNPEELAASLELIRCLEGVLDLRWHTVQGKKQRATTAVRILLEPRARESVLAACFNQTTTLGVREAEVRRATLPRMEVEVEKDGRLYRAKLAQRPNGQVTVKADMDDIVAGEPDYMERELLREEIEALAIDSVFGNGDDED